MRSNLRSQAGCLTSTRTSSRRPQTVRILPPQNSKRARQFRAGPAYEPEDARFPQPYQTIVTFWLGGPGVYHGAR